MLIERDEEIDIVLTALVCGENPLLVGEPGTAKSLLLDSVMRWMDTGKIFHCLFNKFTVPEEVFGPISVKGLKEDIYRRLTTGYLPEAEGAFLDEIFKASSAILNTMLRVLNERVFSNGDGVFRPVPLLLCVGASNEWPDTAEELGALFDRFLFRKTVRYISNRSGRDKLLWGGDHVPRFDDTISRDQIVCARGEASRLAWDDDTKEAFNKIVDELNKEGIRPGDRRLYKATKAVQAYAFLNEREVGVEVEDLEILSHVLWNDPAEQADKAARIINKIANPTGAIINDKMMQIQDILEKNQPTEAVPKLQQIQKDLVALPKHPRKDSAVKYVASMIKETYDRVLNGGSL